MNARTWLLVAGVVVAVHYARKASGAVADAVDPTSRDNIINRTFNAVTMEGPGDSLGAEFSRHCVEKALENGGTFPAALPWYCPSP